MAYKYQEFPRVVYGPAGETKLIESEDERPEGWKNSPKDFTAEAAAQDAENAKKAADLAADNEKAAIKAFLDEHDVEYHPNLGLPKLRELSDQLTAHLEKQGNGNGA
jgi:hypothetical protein